MATFLLVDTKSQNYGNELNFQNTLFISFIGYHDAINKQITNHSIFISVRSKPTQTVERNRLYNNRIERLIRIDNEL